MAMSTDVRPIDIDIARSPRRRPGAITGGAGPDRVDVLFPLVDEDQWPPYPAESVEAVLIAHDLAEIAAVPWFLTDLARGDIVRVRHDGIGYVGGAVVSRGGHSTLHVMAAAADELAPVVRALVGLGAGVGSGLEPPMLAVDVPERVPLAGVLRVLVAAESMTCAFTVACDQHRTRPGRD